MVFPQATRCLLPLVGLLLSGHLQNLRAQVWDEAGLFQADKLAQADREIERIARHHGKGFLFVTMKELTKEQRELINPRDRKMRQELFTELAEQQAKRAKLDGVCVLLCQEPAHIQIVVTPEARDTFSDWDKSELQRLVVRRFQIDNPDQGLLQKRFNKIIKSRSPEDGLMRVLDYVDRAYHWRRPVDMRNWLISLGALIGLLVCWAILGVIRMRLRKRAPNQSGILPPDEGGRSIAVLGGGIGAVSGQWLFQRVMRRTTNPPTDQSSASLDELPLVQPLSAENRWETL